MRNFATTVLLGGLLLFSAVAQAQSTPPADIGYSEQVDLDDSHAATLYQQALAWAQGQFPYVPKSDLQANKAAHEVRLTGTSKVKTVAANAAGAEQERVLRFDFTFRATPQGYTYNVNNFRVVTNAKEPAVTTPLTAFSQQLSQERTNVRTHNDRRVMAQANAVASEVAATFRSYMNSQPVIKDGEIGLSADDAEE
jgi:hypothetical protein